MSPELRRRVDALFAEALEIEPDRRAAFLEGACADDPAAVRAEVESLLAHYECALASNFLEEPARTVRQLSTDRDGRSDPARPPQAPDGYEIVEELGRGGRGVVYKARQVKLDRWVALKMILPGAHAGAQERERFRAEAEAAARFQHPHLVQIYEVGEQGGRAYCVLEYVAGGSLAQQLAGKPLPPRQAATLAEVLAAAVHYAHEHGIVHRDLKPANVLLTADGTPKVTDFGLAKRLDQHGHTQTGAVMGTPSYMAPEQAAGKTHDIGPRTDVWALGAILYEMLTSRPLFQGASALDTLEQVRVQEPVPPSSLQPKVPRDLKTICLKCLHKDPDRRYATADALAEDLRRFLAGEPIRARPVSYAGRLGRWCRRKPLVAGLSAALLAAVAAGFAGVTWQLVRAEQNLEAANAQRQRAEEAEGRARRRFEQVRGMAHRFLFDFDDKLRALPGSVQARQFIVKTSLEYLDNLHKEAGADAALLAELSAAYLKVGDLQGDTLGRNLNDTAGARASYRKALELPQTLTRDDPDSAAGRRVLGLAWHKIGNIQAATGHTRAALDTLQKALGLLQDVARADPGAARGQRDLFSGYLGLRLAQAQGGQTAQALASSRQALASAKALAALDP
jgi:serine/threonine-protein kinase